MPPETQPQDPQEKNSKPAQPAPKPEMPLDIPAILLPKKEVPGATLQSAHRVSAGVLLDQEQKAGVVGLPKTHAPATPVSQAPEKPKEESVVQPLETYQGAIEHMIQGGDVSAVSIAAAEAQRRAQKGRDRTPEAEAVPLGQRAAAFLKKFSMVGAGIVFLVVAAAVLAYVLLRPTTVPVTTAAAAPFISVDDTESVAVPSGGPGRAILNQLDVARRGVTLPVGLIERLIPSVASTSGSGQTVEAMDAQTFLSDVAPNIPPSLLRTIQPTYLLGVHVYDVNQPLLILSVDSYQDAFAGMLSWEYWMESDLAPLFSYVPSVQINPSAPVTLTPAATSSGPVAPPPVPSFVDQIVDNHDARVLLNSSGDIYLLWTFLDRNTLVITTNAATLREIISRLQQAPVTSIPAQ